MEDTSFAPQVDNVSMVLVSIILDFTRVVKQEGVTGDHVTPCDSQVTACDDKVTHDDSIKTEPV